MAEQFKGMMISMFKCYIQLVIGKTDSILSPLSSFIVLIPCWLLFWCLSSFCVNVAHLKCM